MTQPTVIPVSEFFAPSLFPTLPSVGLTEDERGIANNLRRQLLDVRAVLNVAGQYYDGEQAITSLGIAIPDSLSDLRVVLGWPQTGVDALDERLEIEGFRRPNAVDLDQDLLDIWQANDLEEESSLAILDALIYGRAYLIAGPGDDGYPLITCESPLNMIAQWDGRTRQASAAFQEYADFDFGSDTFGQVVSVLYLPGQTIRMVFTKAKGWELVNRDQYGSTYGDGFVPVSRLANRQRTSNRAGKSEITPQWRSIQDAGIRTILGAEVAREIFGSPRRWALGVSEEAFTTPDGKPVEKWQAAMSSIWAIERDENGDLPQVGQFPAAEPTPFKTLLDMYAMQFSSIAALPPHYVGLVSDGNPASAEAIVANESRIVRRVKRRGNSFGGGFEEVMGQALAIMQGRALTPEERQITCEWVDPQSPTIAQTSDALFKQASMGAISPRADVVRKRLGWSATDRQALEVADRTDQGEELLRELASSGLAKSLRTDASAAKIIGGAPITGTANDGASAVNGGQ